MVSNQEESQKAILDDLHVMVGKMMDKNGAKNYKIEMEEIAEAGGFMGEIIFFKVITQKDENIHHFVMKASKRSEKYRKNVPVDSAYTREIFTYTKIFPTFQKFIERVNPAFVFNFVPKLWWISSDSKKESLIFENLKAEGFKLFDKTKPWNLEHSMLVMEHYGKYHAISLALSDQKPEVFRELTKNLTNITNEMVFDVKKFYGGYIEYVMKLLKMRNRHDLVGKYEKILDEIDAMSTSKTEICDKILICHGDSWNNNFLFKYKDENESKPSDVRLLDFQFSLFDSPVFDLSFNIHTTCDKTCLDHLDDLLETYYKTLSKTVESFGSDPNKLFTYKQLQNHWKKYAKFGVFVSAFLIKTVLAKAEESPDLVRDSEMGKNIGESFTFEIENMEEYNRRVLEVFIHFGDRFL